MIHNQARHSYTASQCFNSTMMKEAYLLSPYHIHSRSKWVACSRPKGNKGKKTIQPSINSIISQGFVCLTTEYVIVLSLHRCTPESAARTPMNHRTGNGKKKKKRKKRLTCMPAVFLKCSIPGIQSPLPVNSQNNIRVNLGLRCM